MKFKMNLKTKMLIYILTASSIIYALALGYVSFKLNSIAFDNAKELTSTYAKEYANYTKADINVDINMVRAIAQISKVYENMSPNEVKVLFTKITEHLILENPNFLATFCNFELKAIQPDWQKPFGRLRLVHIREGNKIISYDEMVDTVQGFTRGA